VRVLFITVIVILLDQISKIYVHGINIPLLNINFEGMYLGESISVIGEFFKITYIENPGMAFGFDPGSEYKLIISLFSLGASIGLLIYLYIVREKILTLRVAIALILGGAVGNLIDRMFYGLWFDYAPLFYGKVVDFFDFDFFNFSLLGRNYDRWPIFNIADASVTIGVLILLLFHKKHSAEDETNIEESKPDSEPTTASEQNIDNVPGMTDEINDDQPDKGKEI
jgi:signal peptidase II